MTLTVLLLLIAYQIKHFICDYLLQGRYMLGKFKPYPDYIMPLFCHAMVHFAGTFIIALFVVPQHAVLLASLDALIHFVVDRIKASPSLLGRFEALSKNEMKTILANEEYIKRFRGTPMAHQAKEDNAKKIRSNTLFWYSLGLDQKAHHLTHYLLIVLMVGIK